MPPSAYKRTVTMTISLVVSFGLLVLVSVVAVLLKKIYSATRNTVSLIRDKAELTISLQLLTISEQLQPAMRQVDGIAQAIESGVINPKDANGFRKYLLGAGTSANGSQIRSLAFVDQNFQLTGVERRGKEVQTTTINYARNFGFRAGLSHTRTIGKAHWGQPVWIKRFGETFLNLRRPVIIDGQFAGVVIALVSVKQLSAALTRLDQTSNSVSFILQGRDTVIAHRHMGRHAAQMTATAPLPRLQNFRDPVLQEIWNANSTQPARFRMRAPLKSQVVTVGDEQFVFIWRQIQGYSAQPWIIGSYVNIDYIGEEITRLVRAGLTGLGALMLAIIVAVILGRRIARPVKRLSEAAEKIGALDLQNVEELPGSRITELNQQANAFNAMIGGLQWFEHYVPKALVRRLLHEGEGGWNTFENRNLTVMFTDIIGFSTYVEDMKAAEVAQYLNDHFAILAACIEETGGTVDKFIGDSVMAFWGAPEKLKDRAERACRCATLMRDRLTAENRRRAAAGQPLMRIRVGIHSGEATVGNIGSPDRVNYTVVGDMVNVAARMEQLGKELVTDARDVTVLITEATRQDLSAAFSPRSLGRHQVKGREQAVEVFDLLPPEDEPVALDLERTEPAQQVDTQQ